MIAIGVITLVTWILWGLLFCLSICSSAARVIPHAKQFTVTSKPPVADHAYLPISCPAHH